MKTEDVIKALRQAADVLERENAVIDGFHEYSQAHGCTPGRNVFEFVLEDAKRLRTLLPSQFTRFRCLSCGFRGEISTDEIARHRAQCSHGPTVAEK